MWPAERAAATLPFFALSLVLSIAWRDMSAAMTSAVLLIGTLDTRGREVAYVRDKLHALGVDTLVLDAGILGEPAGITPDIPREQVARAAASTMDWLRNTEAVARPWPK